jgi:hypothetical protein
LLLFAVYLIVPWFIQWGTQDEERRITLPGDEIVAHPHTFYTLAVTIGAAPSTIWPWLVQVGQGPTGASLLGHSCSGPRTTGRLGCCLIDAEADPRCLIE